jgi:hypothetical protein
VREDTETDLRRQLREAWQQIAELQWRLQSEQRNSVHQDRRIASGATSLRETHEQHERDLNERDQELADLEDAHQEQQTGWEHQLLSARRAPAGGAAGLDAIAELLNCAARQPGAESGEPGLASWERRVQIARKMEELAHEHSEAGDRLATLLTRAVFEGDAGCCEVEANAGDSVTLKQVILMGLLLDEWARQQQTESGSSTRRAVIGSGRGERGPEVHIRLSHGGSADELQPFVAALKGRADHRSDANTVITVAGERNQ